MDFTACPTMSVLPTIPPVFSGLVSHWCCTTADCHCPQITLDKLFNLRFAHFPVFPRLVASTLLALRWRGGLPRASYPTRPLNSLGLHLLYLGQNALTHYLPFCTPSLTLHAAFSRHCPPLPRRLHYRRAAPATRGRFGTGCWADAVAPL